MSTQTPITTITADAAPRKGKVNARACDGTIVENYCQWRYLLLISITIYCLTISFPSFWSNVLAKFSRKTVIPPRQSSVDSRSRLTMTSVNSGTINHNVSNKYDHRNAQIELLTINQKRRKLINTYSEWKKNERQRCEKCREVLFAFHATSRRCWITRFPFASSGHGPISNLLKHCHWSQRLLP